MTMCQACRCPPLQKIVPQQDKKWQCLKHVIIVVVLFVKLHYKIKNNDPLGGVFFLFVELRYNKKKEKNNDMPNTSLSSFL